MHPRCVVVPPACRAGWCARPRLHSRLAYRRPRPRLALRTSDPGRAQTSISMRSSSATLMSTTTSPFLCRSRGRCQSEEEAPRDGVVRLNLGAKPFDSRASSPLRERSEELAREDAMLPFVGHQDRDLRDGGVQVVAREPGDAGNAAVFHRSDGFPLAVDEVEQEIQSLVREHGERSVKSEDGTSGRDPVRKSARAERSAGVIGRISGPVPVMGYSSAAATTRSLLFASLVARRTPESDPAGGSRGVHAAGSS